MNKKTIIKKLLSPAVGVLVLTGCSSEHSQPSATQVVAKVNGDEITVSQLKAELHKVTSKVSDQSQLSQKILEGLIDRQLLVQETSKLSLDRTPEVQDAVASAKAQIYAQAYIANKLAKLAPPNEKEVKQFIDEHPYYFSERKIFHTMDCVFENQLAKLDLHWLESEVSTLDALHTLLNEKGVHFQTVGNQFSTDGLPQELLDKIKQVKAGDLLFAHDANNVVIKSVSSIEPYPVPAYQAEQIATRILSEQHKQSFIAKEINRLKGLARIEMLDANLAPDQNVQVPTHDNQHQ